MSLICRHIIQLFVGWINTPVDSCLKQTKSPWSFENLLHQCCVDGTRTKKTRNPWSLTLKANPLRRYGRLLTLWTLWTLCVWYRSFSRPLETFGCKDANTELTICITGSERWRIFRGVTTCPRMVLKGWCKRLLNDGERSVTVPKWQYIRLVLQVLIYCTA